MESLLKMECMFHVSAHFMHESFMHEISSDNIEVMHVTCMNLETYNHVTCRDLGHFSGMGHACYMHGWIGA